MECACYFGDIMFELFDPDADVRIEKGASLPHWYQPGVSYFVTFRTEDLMPAEVSRRWYAQRADWLQCHGIAMGNRNWREQLDRLDVALWGEFHETFSRQYLEALDKDYGVLCCVKRNSVRSWPRACCTLTELRYHMGDFVVMPNHVHLIVCLLGETDIEAQCTSWKRFTAKQINQELKDKRPLLAGGELRPPDPLAGAV